MCGIVFSLTNDTYVIRGDDFFADAMLASQVRGLHSTGIMQLDKSNKMSTFKLAKPATEYLTHQRAQALIRDVGRSPLTVGHVRHATMGGIKDINAHPFVAQDEQGIKVCGVHNGTLRGWKDKVGGDTEEVDSAWAFNMFSEHGPVEAFKFFNGAFAFVWHDEAYPGYVWMARNEDRPLHYFVTEDGKTVLGASELGMLGWLVEKHQFKITKGKQSFFYLRPDKIYKFSLTKVGDITVIDRPAYDPSTTIKKPEPIAMGPTGAHSRDTDIPFGPRSGWGPHGMSGSTGQVGARDIFDDQVETLRMVKEALRLARNGVEAPPTTDDLPFDGVLDLDDLDRRQDDALARMDRRKEADLQAAVEAEIARFQAKDAANDKPLLDPWGLIDEPQFVGAPNDRSCTTEEIKCARDNRIYGRVVGFSGVIWDEDTSETYGEAYIMNPGDKGARTIDCIVRGATAAVAKVRYVETKSMPVMTIVGIMQGIEGVDKIYIVSELTPEARKALFEHAREMKKKRVLN